MIEEARLGSDEAMGRLVEVCRDYLLLVADRELGRELRSKAGVSDVVQETLMKACRSLPAFRGETEQELLAWVRRILLRQVSNMRRSYLETGKRRLAREVSFDPGRGEAAELRDDIDTPSRVAIRHEEEERIRAVVAMLPTHYRQILIWRHWEDRSFKEIATLLGCSFDAARMTWSRAIEALGRRLDCWDDLGEQS
jgi:RNA polymerase sigma-70 factor (ECF subfamily)